MKGVIFDIKHYAIHDGPGVRTTVFFKGCPLGCWWCHNPESRSGNILKFIKKEKIGGKLVTKEETVGRKISVEELIRELEKDVVLFEESGGGVTISGGEPFYQFKFLMQVLKGLKKREIHTCIDTTGHVDSKELIKAAKYTDLFLYDLKHFDDRAHRKYTGTTNSKILENLKLLDQMGKEIEIRYPLIPGMNDDEADLLRMLAFLTKLSKSYPVNILPYHKIGSHKYRKFGLEDKMHGVEEPTDEKISTIKSLFENAGIETLVSG